MKTNSFVCFLLLSLTFMFSATSSRKFGWMKKDVAVQEIHFQDQIESSGNQETMELEDPTRRMAYEKTDYGEPGANDRHNPNNPATP